MRPNWMKSLSSLSEVIERLSAYDQESTIYARTPWTGGSPAIVAPEPPLGGVPAEGVEIDAKYFLEVWLAAELVEDWEADCGPMTASERCDRLIYYATYDA